MKILYIIAAFLGACSFIAKASAGAELAPGTYRAASVKGSAQWFNPKTAETLPLVNDQELVEGAVITTGEGGGLTLVFASGATATIGEKSEVTVSKFEQQTFDAASVNYRKGEPSVSATEIKLTKGNVTSRVSKLKAESSYVIKTPIGAAGVRGTTFRVSYDVQSKILKVETAEGKVVLLTTANVEVPVEGGKDVEIKFEVNEKGEVEVGETVTGNLSEVAIAELISTAQEAIEALPPTGTSVQVEQTELIQQQETQIITSDTNP
jgi:hypothetical protein